MEILARASDPTLSVEEAVRGRLTTLFSDRFIREQADQLEAFVQLSIRHWPTAEGAAGQLGALGVFNVKRRLGEIRCPVLAITGSEDRMMPAENSRLLSEAIEGAQHYSVEGAGHMFFLEQPDEVNRVLISFFSS
jgi:pimeloyl-ACP methyl ester carboxylesterase